ncbi:histone acetyltransferase p300-like [Leptopilina boulardi]|uniref:histone acetyltransferase p300-like n=1 Tax=Leptopilina boulardi TaxID=63433 RepID=UPI0021F645CA|nr:histone acetyltransferase p300-like [Leptopilina boulardi]
MNPDSIGRNQRIETTVAEKEYQIQKHLILLLHAENCLQQEIQSNEESECSLPHCRTMKNVLNHIRNCQLSTCKVHHCFSSKMILRHWRSCIRDQCNVCTPLKEIFRSRQQNNSLPQISSRSNVNPLVMRKTYFAPYPPTNNPNLLPDHQTINRNIRMIKITDLQMVQFQNQRRQEQHFFNTQQQQQRVLNPCSINCSCGINPIGQTIINRSGFDTMGNFNSQTGPGRIFGTEQQQQQQQIIFPNFSLPAINNSTEMIPPLINNSNYQFDCRSLIDDMVRRMKKRLEKRLQDKEK